MSTMIEPPDGSNGRLTNRDHDNIESFLKVVLTRYAAGTLQLDMAVGTLAHVIACLDHGNIGEARRWFEEGADTRGSIFLSG